MSALRQQSAKHKGRAVTRGKLLNFETHGGCFPAVLFDRILEVLPFIERIQSSALDSGDVDEYVLTPCLRLDKSVAFGRIEPLHGAARHFDLPTPAEGAFISGQIGSTVQRVLATIHMANRLLP
jgi:hypothetical protein